MSPGIHSAVSILWQTTEQMNQFIQEINCYETERNYIFKDLR